MDKNQLKQRIVGAIVLVALGVIFIPMILDRDDGGISGSNIPDVPSRLEKLAEREIPRLPPPPKKPEEVRQIIDNKTVTLEVEKKAARRARSETKAEQKIAAKPAQSATKATQKKGRAWVVQVASFAQREKAMALRDKLRKAKFITFVESVSTKKNVLFRVRVGPVVRKSDAEQIQKKIARSFKFKDALVMVHP